MIPSQPLGSPIIIYFGSFKLFIMCKQPFESVSSATQPITLKVISLDNSLHFATDSAKADKQPLASTLPLPNNKLSSTLTGILPSTVSICPIKYISTGPLPNEPIAFPAQ